ncbi:hypothetical protein O0L34_g9340 [Tuta absoluta]|nr:hypothetical protein O0L34_g9340 [Tuta absoluta]
MRDKEIEIALSEICASSEDEDVSTNSFTLYPPYDIDKALNNIQDYSVSEIREILEGDSAQPTIIVEELPSAAIYEQAIHPSSQETLVAAKRCSLTTEQPSSVIKQQPSSVIKQQPSSVIKQQPSSVIKHQPSPVTPPAAKRRKLSQTNQPLAVINQPSSVTPVVSTIALLTTPPAVIVETSPPSAASQPSHSLAANRASSSSTI